jgi:hypothetical protein
MGKLLMNRAFKLSLVFVPLAIVIASASSSHAADPAPSPSPSPLPLPSSSPDPVGYGKKLFQRLAGIPIMPTDSRYAAFMKFITAGDYKSAAAIATADDNFYATTVRDVAAVMDNKDGSPLVTLDDFQSTMIGATRDDLDARTLLTGNYSYRAPASLGLPEPTLSDDAHYAAIDAALMNLSKTLVQSTPQWPITATMPTAMQSAGLLTSRGWAANYYSAGTNRRSVAFSMQIFLCSPIATWKNTSIDDYHIRRDVNRIPGGDPSVFQNTCRGCHGPMDAFGGAFAHFDFDVPSTTFNYLGPNVIAPKYNQNANTYPDGWITTDDSWVNMLADNSQFGWRTQSTGNGINDFGNLLANSAQFSRCMATRSFKEVCRRNATSAEQDLIQSLATNFESGGYHLKSLFQDVAIAPQCLGTP